MYGAKVKIFTVTFPRIPDSLKRSYSYNIFCNSIEPNNQKNNGYNLFLSFLSNFLTSFLSF
jgi:hypothetical protein